MSSNYPPGVTGNEPEIAGDPECPICDYGMSYHLEVYEPDKNIHYYVCPIECPVCHGAGGFIGVADNMDLIECEGCEGAGCIDPAKEERSEPDEPPAGR